MARHLSKIAAIGVAAHMICLAETASISIETPYNHITIEVIGSVVEMRSFWRSKVFRESAVDLSDKCHLLVPYTIFLAASAMFHPNPKNTLMIGLGGGGFNQFYEKAFPLARLETVELDPQVVMAAQKYMGFIGSDRNKVDVLDGRMFLRRTGNTYDWIILDAFRGGFVPPHLKTLEFYKLARAHLAADGLFIANVRTDSALFASDLRTLRAAFPQVGYFDVQQSGNAILVAANFTSPSLESMIARATQLRFNDVFKRNVDVSGAATAFRTGTSELERKAALLTDDFAPTEFLDAIKDNNTRQ